jgi:hypothetical protein
MYIIYRNRSCLYQPQHHTKIQSSPAFWALLHQRPLCVVHRVGVNIVLYHAARDAIRYVFRFKAPRSRMVISAALWSIPL